jgi:hypothetical protein
LRVRAQKEETGAMMRFAVFIFLAYQVAAIHKRNQWVVTESLVAAEMQAPYNAEQ